MCYRQSMLAGYPYLEREDIIQALRHADEPEKATGQRP